MTPEARRTLLRYGIAADLVVLATGVALLIPSSALVLLALYTVAVALSAWKGTWRGAALATVLSIAALLYFVTPPFDASHMSAFVAASVIATAIIDSRRASRRSVAPSAANVVPFDRPASSDAQDREDLRPGYEKLFTAAREQEVRAADDAARRRLAAERAAVKQEVEGARPTDPEGQRQNRKKSKRRRWRTRT